MDAEGVNRALIKASEMIKSAANIDRSSALMSHASTVAAAARRSAASAGDSIMIKVTQRDQKVQIVVTGRNAAKYRAMFRSSMQSSLPQISSEIRHQIIDGSR